MTRLPLLAVAAAGLSLLAGCATTPPTPPPAKPAPAPTTASPPLPTASGEWRDLPLSAGTWTYSAAPSGSVARFGEGDRTALVIRCDKAGRTIRFEPAGARPGVLTITTSYASRSLPLAASGAGPASASLAANDPFLDRIAFSRGRVSYAAGADMPLLMTPAWAEPARVIEDCRS